MSEHTSWTGSGSTRFLGAHPPRRGANGEGGRMGRQPPHRAIVEGEEWAIERAWPASGNRAAVPIEAHRGGEARGGYWSAEAGVRVLPRGEDPRLPGLAAVAAAGEIVSHRPGKRAVVRLDDGTFAKVVRPGRAGGVIEAHTSAGLFAHALSVPRIVPRDFPAGDVVCFSPLDGATFSRLGASGSAADWAAAWRGWSSAWSGTVAAADATGLPAHGADDEASVLVDWAERADLLLGGGDRVRRAAGIVADEVAAVAGAPEALAHRDLHDKQLLWSPDSGIGLIDLDTCARADPALDLGNLSAHADLAVRLGNWAPARGRVAQTAIGEAADALGVGPERLSAWRRAARFRVACVHLLRPASRRAAHDDLGRLVSPAEHDATRAPKGARERRALP